MNAPEGMTWRRAASGMLLALAALATTAPLHAQGVPIPAVRAGGARVQPGDLVIVKLPREPKLSDSVTVNARGNIALGKIGTVPAASFTIDALEDTLRARYGVFLRRPEVTVSVLRRVVVNGEVRKPDVYFVDLSSTLRDAIARAGGITELGSTRKVSIIRDGVNIPEPNWQDDVSGATDLRSGDQVYVGMRSWVDRNTFAIASTGILVTSFILSLIRR